MYDSEHIQRDINNRGGGRSIHEGINIVWGWSCLTDVIEILNNHAQHILILAKMVNTKANAQSDCKIMKHNDMKWMQIIRNKPYNDGK